MVRKTLTILIFIFFIFLLASCNEKPQPDNAANIVINAENENIINEQDDEPEIVVFTINETPILKFEISTLTLEAAEQMKAYMFKDCIIFDGGISYTDDSGNEYTADSIEEMFENVEFIAIDAPSLASTIVNNTVIEDQRVEFNLSKCFYLDYSEGGHYVYELPDEFMITVLIVSIDGTIYEFPFAGGEEFVAEKSDSGYRLLPIGTID